MQPPLSHAPALLYWPAMSLATRYILGRLAAATLAITAGLGAAVWLTQSLRLVDLIVNRELPFGQFLKLALLLLPGLVGTILPIALGAAVLIVYDRLASDRELGAMTAAGMGPGDLGRPVLIVSALGLSLGYAITLYAQPIAHRAFADLQHEIRSSWPIALVQPGVFIEAMEGVTVYVRDVGADGMLGAIMIADERDPRRSVMLVAEHGRLLALPDGRTAIELVGGSRQELRRDSGRYVTLSFERYVLDPATLVAAQATRWREPRERFLGELLDAPLGPEDARQAGRLMSEAHTRLASPLYAPALALLAFAAVLRGGTGRPGRGRRIGAVAVSMIALEGVSLALRHIATGRPDSVWLLYLPPATVLVAAVSIHAWPSRGRLQSPRMATA